MGRILLIFCVIVLFVVKLVPSFAAGEVRFTGGVASGEVTARGAILWTRVDQRALLFAQIARDRDFRHTVRFLPVKVQAETDFTVRVQVHALLPNTRYFYRFVHVSLHGGDFQTQVSATGTFRTTPHWRHAADVHFAFSGDSEAVFQPFQVLQAIQDQAPDFFVYLGDTIYADNDSEAGNVALVSPQESLAVYRAKYRENRADVALRNLLAAVPIYAIWDDHEVINDFAGETVDPTLYAKGRQAFLEYMPIAQHRLPADPHCAGDPLFRVFRWGKAVQIIILDERSCRSADVAAACGHDPVPTLPPEIRQGFGLLPTPQHCLDALFAPSRTMLGGVQKARFKEALLDGEARFKFVINQVPIQQFWGQPYDRWEGYAAERAEILHFIRDHGIEHVIFLTTDTHANLINEVFVDRFADPSPVGHEFVTGPIAHPTLQQDILATQGEPGLAGFNALLTLAGVECRHLNVFSYGSVEVNATAGTTTITLKDNTGQVVRDQGTSLECQKTLGALSTVSRR
jgi:alkaline phosphatase D